MLFPSRMLWSYFLTFCRFLRILPFILILHCIAAAWGSGIVSRFGNGTGNRTRDRSSDIACPYHERHVLEPAIFACCDESANDCEECCDACDEVDCCHNDETMLNGLQHSPSVSTAQTQSKITYASFLVCHKVLCKDK